MDSADLSTLTFFASAPALGFETYLLALSQSAQAKESRTVLEQVSASDITISGAYVSATVSGSTGRLASVSNSAPAGASLAIDLNYYWYNASIGNSESSQASGKSNSFTFASL